MDKFTKITTGFVVQSYVRIDDGRSVCTGQEFIAGETVDFEDSEGNAISAGDHVYQPFNMTLLSTVQIADSILEVLDMLNVSGEQSRQFAEEIGILNTLLKNLEGDAK